ncbi:TIR domain-containing protein [Streptomyces sp. NPDC057280]|uniref:TIR domain-containing protein n=1 Tax=Streptomyces sp. NPDC057280 TaxID=3346081 RepID=UPI00363B3D20
MLPRKRPGAAADPGKHVFLSYSRRDLAYVEQLEERLAERKVTAWIDLSDIPVSARWREEVADGIRRSDVFFCVVSPQWLASAPCREELSLALEFGKRIVPLLHGTAPEDLPVALADRNCLRDGVDAQVVADALALDLERVHHHTRLLVQAHEWSVSGRRRSALLRGAELRAARAWLAGATAGDEPTPTPLQREYVAKARTARGQRWGLGTVLTAVLVTVALLVGFARVEAEHRDRSRELATRSEDALQDGLDRALLLGREAAAERPTVEARRALLTALRTRPRQQRYLDALAGVPAAQREEPRSHLPLAVQPGGRLLAVPVKDGVRLVTLPAGRPAWTVKGPVGSPVFSPDGRWLAVATHADPRTVQLVDVRERRVVERLTVPQSRGRPNPGNDWGPSTSPDAVAFAPDSASLAIPANDNTVRIRLLREHRWRDPLKGHSQVFVGGLGKDTNFITAVAFSPDGRTLVSGDWRGDVLVWDVRTGRRLKTLSVEPEGDDPPYGVESLAFHPKGGYLAAGTGRQTLVVWHTRDWSPAIAPTRGDTVNPIQALAFSPDGEFLVTAGWRTGPLIRAVGAGWDVVGDRLSRDHLTGTSVVFTDQGRSMIWGVQGTGMLAVWDVHGPGPLGEVVPGSPGDAVALAVGDDSAKPFAVGGADGTIALADGRTLRHALGDRSTDVSLRSLALSEDERTLYSAADDGSVNVWDVASGTPRSRWALGNGISAMAFGDHGRLLAVARGEWLLVYRTSDHRRLVKVPEGAANVRELVFAQDGSLLAAGAEAGVFSLVDVGKGRVLDRFSGYRSYVRALAFSPDGRTLAVGSEDGTYALWNVRDRKRIGDRSAAHIGKVFSADFSPDGTLLALGGEKGRTLLVDVPTRRALGPALTADTAPLPCAGSPCRPVRDVVFTQDGKHLLSTTNAARHIYGTDLTVINDPASVRRPGATVWSTGLDAWLRAACVRAARDLTPAERERFRLDDATPCTP